jgi:hypothetical protein
MAEWFTQTLEKRCSKEFRVQIPVTTPSGFSSTAEHSPVTGEGAGSAPASRANNSV